MRHKAALPGDTRRSDISGWMWLPCSNPTSWDHPWSRRTCCPRACPFGMSPLQGVDIPGLCLVLGAPWAIEGAILLSRGLPVSTPRGSSDAREPSSPSAQTGVRNMLLPWQGSSLPISLLPNKHPCQNS